MMPLLLVQLTSKLEVAGHWVVLLFLPLSDYTTDHYVCSLGLVWCSSRWEDRWSEGSGANIVGTNVLIKQLKEGNTMLDKWFQLQSFTFYCLSTGCILDVLPSIFSSAFCIVTMEADACMITYQKPPNIVIRIITCLMWIRLFSINNSRSNNSQEKQFTFMSV